MDPCGSACAGEEAVEPAEAAENDLLDRSVAQGIVSLKRVHQSGDRAGNWLSREQARDLLAQPEAALCAALDSGVDSRLYSRHAAYPLCAPVERVESSWLSGFTFLVQFTQEENGDLPNNGELNYKFLGVTKDGA